ncbi:hypothetical protein TNCT_446641 [Trichonephila clavata]|uniref:Uncharacterized protein n=1 Tax=Trichonephila clavata TaxID=2740835 RepID=A0A8X6HFV9_TRICU|nr:hypothetical protein TNCT_446641 [Trichonephila clavata]
MRTAQLGKDCWSKVDSAARKEIKSILSLPTNAAVGYVHGSRKFGNCGVPSAAEDSDFYLVDSAFKLLTSKDEEVAIQALANSPGPCDTDWQRNRLRVSWEVI